MSSLRNISCFFFVSVIALSTLIACSKTPDGVIPPKKMAQIVADLEIGDAVVSSEPARWHDDSIKRRFRQSILLTHGVSTEQLDTSLYWYGHHMDLYTEVYDMAIEILEQRSDEARQAGTSTMLAQEGQTNLSLDGDSVDVWNGSHVRRFASASPAEIATFSINRDRNWETGDVFELRFKASPSRGAFNIAIAADYTGGKTPDNVVTQRRNDGRWINIKLPLDSAARPTRLFGSIGYQPVGNEVVWIDSISLIRIHRKNR